jgi:hypothetical protein
MSIPAVTGRLDQPPDAMEFSMFTKSKVAAVALAALTLGASVSLPTGEAQARGGWGWGLGAGLVAGTAIGVAAANSYSPAYVYAPRCRLVRQYNNGFYVGMAKVCNY